MNLNNHGYGHNSEYNEKTRLSIANSSPDKSYPIENTSAIEMRGMTKTPVIAIRLDPNDLSTDPPLDDSNRELSHEEKAMLKLAKPLFITDMFVDKPWSVLLYSLAALLCMTAVVAYFEMYVLHQFTVRDYLVWTDPKTWDFDKSNLVKQELMAVQG
jgi:hypothetical protein